MAGAATTAGLAALVACAPAAAAGIAAPRAAAGATPRVEAAASTGASTYTALAPARILDTRQTGQTIGPGATLDLTVTGGSVPAAATAVALNVTVTGTSAGSYLSAYPAGGSRPLVSNLNWAPDQTIPTLVIVPVGSAGQVAFHNAQGDTQLVVDLEGYFAPATAGSTAGAYVPLSPARICDTRSGSGHPCAGSPLGPSGTLDVQVAGAGGVPASGAGAVLLNVTATGASSPTFLTVYPEGTAQPVASNLNVAAGQTVANRVLVPLGASGGISVFNAAGSTDVVIDVSGYFSTGGASASAAGLFVPVTPFRVLDTRATGQTLGARAVLRGRVGTYDGISASADALVANITSVDGTAGSYFTVYPGPGRPATSDVNWGRGATISNLTVTALGSTGSLSVYNAAGSADLIIDAFGYFVPSSPPAAGARFDTGNPSANDTGLGGTLDARCSLGSTAQCEAASVIALDGAMAGEGLAPTLIPPTFWSLPYDQQLLFLANADRTARNLPSLTGPVSQLDGYALTGARNHTDPVDPNPVSWGSNWAGDFSSVASEFDWMYNDGPGSGNLACTSSDTSGCWGHRDNIIATLWTATAQFGGACVATSPFPLSCAEIFVQP